SCDRLEDDIPLAFTATGAPGTPAPSPTTLPAADSSATVSPSETPPAVAAAPTETPTVLFGAIVGGESPIVPPASPSPLPSATPTPQPVTPASSGPFGPIVGPGHTLVPTETRAPTQTAIPSGPFGPIVGPDHTLVPT